MADKPIAFLIMPFGEEFDAVYESFMKPVLQGVGFEVHRADDIESQQNILKDIVDRISSSDLIVADLTGGNPNVFYELGLAHAIRKPVILATQSVEEVPFDLKSYRLLEYSTHFVEIEKSKQKLIDYANGFLEGNVPFGSPVTDFLPADLEPSWATEAQPYKIVEQDERGFLDHLIDINGGYRRLTEIIAEVTGAQDDMTQSVEDATGELTRISANPSDSSPAAVRAVSRRLAERIGTFNSRLKQANVEYASIAQDTENSLEFVVSFQLEHGELEEPAIAEGIASLRQLLPAVIEARDTYLGLAKTMAELPRLERRLNREVTRGSEEIRVMAANLDKTIASISRALKIPGP